MTIKIRKKLYNGKNCFVIYINKVTKKIRERAIQIQLEEQFRQNEIAEGYRATINHELRSPV